MKQLITELKAKLNSINIVTQDSITIPLTALVWNNQIEYLRQGQQMVLPNICSFVEIIVNNSNAVGGQSYNIDSELTINIHLLHTHYSTEGSNDENLLVYDLRKLVIDKLYNYKSNSMVSTINKISEQMDYDHDNLYHYILTYNARIREQINTENIFTLSVPPISLQLDVNEQTILPHGS